MTDGRAAASTIPSPSQFRDSGCATGCRRSRAMPALQSDRERRTAGYTEASRGCKHRCRHCPIVPVYDGRFRVVAARVVLADIRAQVAAGARHITFGDPDFFNGIRHACAIVERRSRASSRRDLRRHDQGRASAAARRRCCRCFARPAALFVTSAVESVDDRVLAQLEKGHTRADFERAVALCRDAGAAAVADVRRVHALDDAGRRTASCCRRSIAWSSSSTSRRFSSPSGCSSPRDRGCWSWTTSARWSRPFDAASLTYPWRHADPRGGSAAARGRSSWSASAARPSRARGVRRESGRTRARPRGIAPPSRRSRPLAARATMPYLNEPWYC